MRFKNLFLWASIIVFVGCSAPKVIVSYHEIAENAATQGNYAEAVEAWKQYFSQKPVDETEAYLFAKAAQTAFMAGNNELAVGWFDQARYKDFADAEMYATLAKIFRSQGNLSKELSSLEYYSSNFGDSNDTINSRLFDVYYEIDMYDKAYGMWEILPNAFKNEISKQKAFFKMNAKIENIAVCDSLSLLILEKEPENIESLEWNAKKYYWLAENHYREQMALYEKNKTNRQYLVLLEELKRLQPILKRLYLFSTNSGN
jgi:tetratricopeptide (TPR) repeat protein